MSTTNDRPLDSPSADYLAKRLDVLEAKIDSGFERQDARSDQHDARFDQHDARFDQHDARFDRMEGWISGIRGRQYEQHCRETVSLAMARYIRRAEIADSGYVADRLSDAFENGAIDHQQYHSATMTDIIGQGYCRQRQAMVMVAAEASVRLNRRDVDRARERADILTAVTGDTHAAYCIGHRPWSEHLASYAEGKQVTLVHYHWDGLTEFSETQEEDE